MIQMKLNTIPIECWLCQSTYEAPALLHLLPAQDPDWYSRKVSAKVWCWVDKRVIAAHLHEHWPILLFAFALWRVALEQYGIDVLGTP